MRSYAEMLKLAAEPQQDSDGTPLTWWQRMQLEIQQQQRRETQQRPVYSSYIPSSGTFVDARPQTPQQQRFWQWWNGEEQAPRQQAAGAQSQTQQPVPTAQQAPAPVSSVTKPSNEPQQVPTQSGPMQLSSPSWQQTGALGPEGAGYLRGLSRSIGGYQASLNAFRTQGLGAKQQQQQPKPSTPMVAPKPVQAQAFPHSPGYVSIAERRRRRALGLSIPEKYQLNAYWRPPKGSLEHEQRQLAADRAKYGPSADAYRHLLWKTRIRDAAIQRRSMGQDFRDWTLPRHPITSSGRWLKIQTPGPYGNGRRGRPVSGHVWIPDANTTDPYNKIVTYGGRR